jgi:lipoprotein-anchoring transpeptidase ErfK/SrfK
MSYLSLARALASAALALTAVSLGGAPAVAGSPGHDQTTVRQQERGFWTAQVTWPTANVHAKPNAGSDIRRVANEGDLLRVAGRSQGIDGDGGEWWATTDGYVAVDGLREASGEWVDAWQMPDPSSAPSGFWVEVTSDAQARAGPTLAAPVVGTLDTGARVKVLGEEQDPDGDPTPWYRIDGGRYAGGRLYSGRTTRLPDPQPNATPPAEGAGGQWIVVDRKVATLTLVRDGTPALSTYVSLGRAGVDTPSGQYRIVNAVRSDEMSSARNPTADRSYALPGVPSILYFTEAGDAIHGTYWHDKFGTQESQGCINLTITDAANLFGATGTSTPLVILD